MIAMLRRSWLAPIQARALLHSNNAGLTAHLTQQQVRGVIVVADAERGANGFGGGLGVEVLNQRRGTTPAPRSWHGDARTSSERCNRAPCAHRDACAEIRLTLHEQIRSSHTHTNQVFSAQCCE